MAVSMNTFWDNAGTIIPGGDAEYVVAEQPIAEYDNWFNYNIVADIQAVIDDVINRFNANTILKADTDNTPAALVVAEQTIVGRKTGNSIAALTDAEVLLIIGVEAGATADQTDAEIRDAVEAATDSNTFNDADHTKLNGIETAADVTDATNVAAATAVMDADFSATEGFMRKTGAGAYTVIKSNLSAAVAPVVGDDSASGYGVGSQWADTTADKVYICVDASVGVAVWKETSLAEHYLEHLEGGGDIIEYYDRFEDANLHTNATERSTSSTSYVKLKETEMTNCADTLAIRFSLKALTNKSCTGRIYRNGVAVGTEQYHPHTVTWTAYTETISGWTDGDLLQLYVKATTAYTSYCKDLIIRGEIKSFARDVSGLTDNS